MKNPLSIDASGEPSKTENESNNSEEKQDKQISGVQGVIDTITFSCCFYQKQVLLPRFELRNKFLLERV